MIEINLLPKGYNKKSFSLSLGKTGVYAVAGAVGVVLMLAAVTLSQMRQLSQLDENILRARQRAATLQRDIQLVDALIDVKSKISSRMKAVDQLDRHRSAYVRVLEDLARNVPEYVWLAKVSEVPVEAPKPAVEGEQKAPEPNVISNTAPIKIEGYTFTLNALAKYMINMMRSDYFDKVELVSTEEKRLNNQKAYNFVLTCDLHFLSDEDLRRMIAQAPKGDKSVTSGHKVLN